MESTLFCSVFTLPAFRVSLIFSNVQWLRNFDLGFFNDLQIGIYYWIMSPWLFVTQQKIVFKVLMSVMVKTNPNHGLIFYHDECCLFQ